MAVVIGMTIFKGIDTSLGDPGDVTGIPFVASGNYVANIMQLTGGSVTGEDETSWFDGNATDVGTITQNGNTDLDNSSAGQWQGTWFIGTVWDTNPNA